MTKSTVLRNQGIWIAAVVALAWFSGSRASAQGINIYSRSNLGQSPTSTLSSSTLGPYQSLGSRSNVTNQTGVNQPRQTRDLPYLQPPNRLIPPTQLGRIMPPDLQGARAGGYFFNFAHYYNYESRRRQY